MSQVVTQPHCSQRGLALIRWGVLMYGVNVEILHGWDLVPNITYEDTKDSMMWVEVLVATRYVAALSLFGCSFEQNAGPC